MSTVPGSQTDLFLNPSMEGEQYTTNINATYVCFPTLDYTGLSFNLVLESEKMLPIVSSYPVTFKDGQD